MSRNEMQMLRDFRSEIPEPDDETAQRVYSLATAARRRPARSATRRRSFALRGALVATGLAAFAAFLALGSPGGRPGVESAVAAVQQAAVATAASADESGTAAVRITHGGDLWAAKSVRWHGDDVAISREESGRQGKPGSELLVVDGAVYSQEFGDWIKQGSPENIDPDSGTTPAEYLAAVREDVGGATLRRITDGMSGLTTRQLDDGATVYSGSVAASLIARETGFKEGESLRVLPFGYVAHDEAANPEALLDVAVTVGADGIVREIAVNWGTWTYSVDYSGLGTTPPLVAPANARDLLRERRDLLRARSSRD